MKRQHCKRYHERDWTAKALLGFNDTVLMVIGIFILGMFIPVVFFQQSLLQAFECFLTDGIWSILFTAIFWMGNRRIIMFFRKHFADDRDLTKRLVKQTVSIAIYTLLVSVAVVYIQMRFQFGDVHRMESKGTFRLFAVSFTSSILVAAIYEAVYFFMRWKQSIAETEKIKKERISSQLEALKNQVNPHFLFNSLNTLASIIPEDPKRAVEFVQKMSAVYRNILDLNEKQVVTLEEELDTLEKYIFLVQTRFPENLSFEMHIDDSARDRYIVPMSVQNLVENALKHNIISKKKPLHITLETSGEELVVTNNLQKKITEEKGTGTGLRNIDNRYRLTFGRRITVEETEQTFGVRIPLVNI